MSETTTEAVGSEAHTVTDAKGRTLVIRRLNMMEEFDLIEAAGAENSQNARWMQYATIVACVRSIDGMPSPPFIKKQIIRNWVGRVGSEGYAAVVKALDLLVKDEDDADGSAPATADQVKN